MIMALLLPFRKCFNLHVSTIKWRYPLCYNVSYYASKSESHSSKLRKASALDAKEAGDKVNSHFGNDNKAISSNEHFGSSDFSNFAEKYGEYGEGNDVQETDMQILSVNEVLQGVRTDLFVGTRAENDPIDNVENYISESKVSKSDYKVPKNKPKNPVSTSKQEKSISTSKAGTGSGNKKKIILINKDPNAITDHHKKILNNDDDISTKKIVQKGSYNITAEKMVPESDTKQLSKNIYDLFKEIEITKAHSDSLVKNVNNLSQETHTAFENNYKNENVITEQERNEEKCKTYRQNSLGIQMLSNSLYNQIFSQVPPKNDKEAEEDFQRSKIHLEEQSLWGREPSVMSDYDFSLPPLEGSDLDQHFYTIAEEQCAPYKELLKELLDADLPEFPSQWQYTPGWTQYNSDGSFVPVDYPNCRALVFDVEVCVREGNHPVLATAVSQKHWYSWCSNHLISENGSISEVTVNDLIPMERSLRTDGEKEQKTELFPRVVVGHNVSYDRLRVSEQYQIERTPLRFVDTMSLHIAVSGLVSVQRGLTLKNKSNALKIQYPWMFVGCQNSLRDVYKFYCRPKDNLQKDIRDVFVKGSIGDVRNDFQNLMTYCAIDVQATSMVLRKLLPLFFERFPHPVTFSGMLEMGLTFLPVTQNWNKYIEASETQYRRFGKLLNEELVRQSQEALTYLKNDRYKEDPWLWDLDWSVPKGRVKKLVGYPAWYRKLCARTGEREGTPEPENMSTSLHIVPKLLRLTWNGFPLHYEREFGWGFLKPLYEDVSEIEFLQGEREFPVDALYELCSNKKINLDKALEARRNRRLDSPETEEDWELLLSVNEVQGKVGKEQKSKSRNEDKEILHHIGIVGVAFVPLPHKDGPGNRVGNPLAKDFLNKIEDNTLSSHHGEIAKLVLKTNNTLSYWKNNRDRILSQIVIWDAQNGSFLSDDEKDYPKCGVILPMVVTAGTITRRSVEPTWMTASNAYTDRIGSELKAMVEAPPGYKFVGADVDSQELWIAAVLGDAYLSSEHGGTALGWMTLQGKKSDGSDMHSRTASLAGISRDHAKVINYGRIYGAGVNFMQRLLKQFNHTFSDEEAKNRALSLFEATKGKKCWVLSESGLQLALEIGYPLIGEALTRTEVSKFLRQASQHGINATFDEIVNQPPVWIGGSESHMFNCLEAIARSPTPKTPVLGARMTRALEPQYVGDQFMTSRVNWVVQSSAVDYLHLMLVCMQWLFKKYDINGRFCISIHDEVRYMVASEDCYRAALALQITNLLTRSLFAQKLGFKDLPQSVAFFSSIDIDQVMRKEPHLDCITPSNPEGLEKGYGILPGASLDIEEILRITDGKLSKRKPEKCLPE